MGSTFRHRFAALANAVLGKADVAIVRRSELDGYRKRYAAGLEKPSTHPSILPEGALEFLRPDNPRLRELTARYAAIRHAGVAHSQWEDLFERSVQLPYLRADNPYVWQAQDRNEDIHYILTAYYSKAIDPLGLFERLGEDGAFGATVFPFAGDRLISRDLLDSVNELCFLEEKLGLSHRSGFNVLDIGAGYGRFAHRLVQAFPEIRALCTDAIAGSTFVCEYYLGFRGVADRAVVVPLDELHTALEDTTIDLAVNIHSFSECRRASIRWWLDLVASKRVQYLFIVPNAGSLRTGEELLSSEGGGRAEDFLPDVVARGYELIAKQPKYRDPLVQKYGVSPTHYFLFERR